MMSQTVRVISASRLLAPWNVALVFVRIVEILIFIYLASLESFGTETVWGYVSILNCCFVFVGYVDVRSISYVVNVYI